MFRNAQKPNPLQTSCRQEAEGRYPQIHHVSTKSMNAKAMTVLTLTVLGIDKSFQGAMMLEDWQPLVGIVWAAVKIE